METKSLRELNKKLGNIGKELAKAQADIEHRVIQKIAEGANEIRNTIIESMARESKTGRWYRRGKKRHQASAPGEPPAVDTGELISRIIYDVRESSLEVEIGAEAGAPYAEPLEFGAWGGMGEWHLEPRPWLNPAVDKHQDQIIKEVGDEAFKVIQEGFNKGVRT